MPPLFEFDKLRDREEFEAILERFAEKIAEKISIPSIPERIERVAPSIPLLDREFHYFTYPSDGTKKTVGKGVTQIDFFTGKVTLPDGTEEMLSDSLRNHEEPFIKSFMIDVDEAVVFWLDNAGKKPIDLDDLHGETYQNFRNLYLETTKSTTFFVWACTNPEAFLRRFKPAIFRKVINEFDVTVNPMADIGKPIVRLGHYAGSSTTYQNLASATIPANHYGVIRELSFTSDSLARYKLSIGTTVQFDNIKVVSPPSIPFPPHELGTATTITLQVKSGSVGGNIEVNGLLCYKRVPTIPS